MRKLLWNTFARANSHVGIQVSCSLERYQQHNREPPLTNTVTLTSFWGAKCCLAQGNSKESSCNAEDPGLIPESRRFAGEEIGSPLQYSWASLVAQLVKSLPTMWKIGVQPLGWEDSLGWEDPLEKGTATHSSILAWRIPWTVQSMALQKVGHDWLSLSSNLLIGFGF